MHTLTHDPTPTGTRNTPAHAPLHKTYEKILELNLEGSGRVFRFIDVKPSKLRYGEEGWRGRETCLGARKCLLWPEAMSSWRRGTRGSPVIAPGL